MGGGVVHDRVCVCVCVSGRLGRLIFRRLKICLTLLLMRIVPVSFCMVLSSANVEMSALGGQPLYQAAARK